MSKHTPGPWHVVEEMDDDGDVLYSIEADNVPVADIYRKAEHEANARLIAAAPELLEALMSILDYAPEMELCIASRYGGDSFTYVGFSGHIADAKAAIAKATGEDK